MINYDEAWREENYFVKDSEKFKIMTKVYETIFEDKAKFAKKIGVGRATVFNWMQKENASFNAKSKIKICRGFKLTDTVWRDTFYTEDEFSERLRDYEKVEPKPTIREGATLIQLKKNKDDSMKIESLTPKEIDILLKNGLKKKSGSFMFALAERLTNEKRVEDALKVIGWIENQNSTFKYTHSSEIMHKKAILLSHDSVKDWDGAIDLLRSLYHSHQYHLKQPEILTLLASNYKRKALDGHTSKDEIDIELLTSALCLYEDSYNIKPDNTKYYDAINLAYLYNIVDVIEIEYADKVEIEELYKNLSSLWRIDKTNWWEVCSDAEFLMLLGKVDLAILNISDFLENHPDKVSPFAMDVVFRQLKLYITLSDDENAKRFLGFLEESWVNISN
jgi:tetratricopeptide (TPR) repeat protein